MLSLQEINEEMSSVKDWSLEMTSISKSFSFKDFKESLEFVNKVGEIAERLNHHPDIIINYNAVRLILTTHSINELTKIDFSVAREIDKI